MIKQFDYIDIYDKVHGEQPILRAIPSFDSQRFGEIVVGVQ